ncbi:MAG: single-stranded DNA-binding protein, partial [Acidimicrobiales bacterium]
VWKLATSLGFGGGDVLEPGCGSGAFMATTPPGLPVHWTGVEPDHTAASIAQLRIPGAHIVQRPIQDVQLPDGAYDLAISNVPFGHPGVDDVDRTEGLSLRNFCILRALRAVRVGGLVLVVTSRYTLDATSSWQRERLASLGDLLGAIRLPSGAFSDAGTSVVTDIVAFRRRGDASPAGEPWLDVTNTLVPGVPVNEHVARHPSRILGRLRARPGGYGRPVLAIDPPDDLEAALDAALTDVVAAVRAQGRTDRCRSAGPSGWGTSSPPKSSRELDHPRRAPWQTETASWRQGSLRAHECSLGPSGRPLTPPSRPAPALAKRSTPQEDTAMATRTTTPEAPESATQAEAPEHATQAEAPEHATQAETAQRRVVDVTGNVVRKPELRYTASGTPICNVRLAIDSEDGQRRFLTIAAWDHLAEIVSAHAKQGDRLGVRGPVGQRQWTGRDGTERTDTTVTAWVLHLHRRSRPVTAEEGA